MIHIEYFPKLTTPSKVGFFADEPIKKGTVIYSPGISSDQYVTGTPDQVHDLALKKWGFFDDEEGMWVADFDFSQCTSPANEPNMSEDKNGGLIAARDIKKGEELTRKY